MFTDLFGGAPHARVFDYLAEESDLDHTITEISQGAGVARPTVYKVVDDFLDQQLIEETRTVGNSRFFQLNEDNQTVQDLLRVISPAEFADFDVGIGEAEQPRTKSGGRSKKRQPR